MRRASRAVLTALVLTGPLPARAVDGVVEINAAGASAGGITPTDAPGLPVTIDRSGSYILTGNIQAINRSAIEITASRVTLDLNGYALSCVNFSFPSGPCVQGTGVDADQSDWVTIRGGTISGFGANGILVDEQARIEGMRIISNAFLGINARGDSVIRDNIVSNQTNGGGIAAGARAVVRGNVVANNGGTGIGVQEGSVVSGNAVTGNDGIGIFLNKGCTASGNSVRENDTGISALGGGLISHNSVERNRQLGLNLLASDGYLGNTISANNQGGNPLLEPQVGGGVDLGGNLCSNGNAPIAPACP